MSDILVTELTGRDRADRLLRTSTGLRHASEVSVVDASDPLGIPLINAIEETGSLLLPVPRTMTQDIELHQFLERSGVVVADASDDEHKNIGYIAMAAGPVLGGSPSQQGDTCLVIDILSAQTLSAETRVSLVAAAIGPLGIESEAAWVFTQTARPDRSGIFRRRTTTPIGSKLSFGTNKPVHGELTTVEQFLSVIM